MNTLDKDKPLVLPPRKSVFIFGGLGGVGKTTSAAAFSLSLAYNGAKVMVITVDPAKRLLDTFGFGADTIGAEEPRNIPLPAALWLREPKGELWVSMLDTKVAFDDLISRLSDTEDGKDAILSNAVYKSISTGFAYGSEYIAMERVLHLYEQDKWDYIIVDTPPGENFFTLFAAPKRMAQFFSSKTLRFLTAPYRSKFLNIASKPVYDVFNRLLGLEMLFQISEFFKLFEPLRRKFTKRANDVEEFLVSPTTKHIVVTTLDNLRSEAIIEFIDKFLSSSYELSAVICNSTLPEFLSEKESIDFARHLAVRKNELIDNYVADELEMLDSSWRSTEEDTVHSDAAEQEFVLRSFLKSLGENFLNYALLAAGENAVYEKIVSHIRQEYSIDKKAQASVIKLPYLLDPAGDMEKIAFLGEAISSSIFGNKR